MLEAGLTEFDLACSAFDKTGLNAGMSVALTKDMIVVYEQL